MAHRSSLRFLLPLAALGLVGMLGGCVAYPAYGYGYGAPYYGAPYYGGGWGHGHGWGHEGGWHH